MPVNVDPEGYTDHLKSHPIGTILSAALRGKDVVVSGVLHAKYWPKEVATINANKNQLCMSYEIGSCAVEDDRAPVWTLKDFRFQGAAVLLKSAAAYGAKTSIAASTSRPDCWTPAMRRLRAEGRRLAEWG